MPTVDLAPLVSHIATLEDQVQRLAEASTMWQIRARQAEEQLKQLTAGNVAPENAPESVASPETNETEPHGFWDRVHRFWNGKGFPPVQPQPGHDTGFWTRLPWRTA